MHELSIAQSIFEAVREEASRHPGARVCKVGLRIGEWAGVDPEALRFCFDALVRSTSLEPLALEIETCARLQRCARCAHTFRVVDYNTVCPACRSAHTECIGGTELELSVVELEEP
jgi:hydrogenase nickel incorporation protein HypA/HybF